MWRPETVSGRRRRRTARYLSRPLPAAHCPRVRQRGVSLIEMLVYTGILILIATAVSSTILALSRVYRSIAAEQRVEEAAMVALERMVRETRRADSIDEAQSIFDTSSGQLTIHTTDGDSTPLSMQFFLTGGGIHIKEGDVDIGPLTPASTRTTKLLFRSITTPQSKAVKIEMTVESGTSTSYRSKSFYGTAILRGSYTQ